MAAYKRLLCALFISLCLSSVLASKTEVVEVPHCEIEDNEVDAVAFVSQHGRSDYECEVTVSADQERFVILYQALQLNYDVELEVRDNANQSLNKFLDHKTKLSELLPTKQGINSTSATDGAQISQGRRITFYYKNREYIVENNRVNTNDDESWYNFTIVATSFKKRDSECENDEVLCGTIEDGVMCIDSDLECDRYVNCPNGNDERDCVYPDEVQLPLAVQIIVVVLIIGSCVGCIAGIVFCQRRMGGRQGGGQGGRTPLRTGLAIERAAQGQTAPPAYHPQAPAGSYPTQAPQTVAYTPAPAPPPGQYPPAPPQAVGPPPAPGYGPAYPQPAPQYAAAPPTGQAPPPQAGYQAVATAPPPDVAYPPAPYTPGQAPPAYGAAIPGEKVPL